MELDSDEPLHPGEEDLDWTDSSVKEKKPKGLYSKTSETARGLISTETQCALFCGGKKCKYCSAEGWSPDQMVINGLYSQWVTENILAMARPSNHTIEKHHLVEAFVKEDIKSIINLQIAGEHAECGPHKLDPSGFLYNPQKFMEKGIFFYNFGWPDYGVASLSTILDMVKVMQFAVSLGKVAVHCHAGRGRTGVIIACYLVFTNRISGRAAIHYVREKRPHSIQTRQQMQVIDEFEKYLRPFRIVYASRFIVYSVFNYPKMPYDAIENCAGTDFIAYTNSHLFPKLSQREKGSYEISLQQFLNRQRHVLHGYESRRLKYIPKIVYVVCERLLELAKKGSSLQNHLDKVEPKLEQTFSHLHVDSPRSKQPSTIKPSPSKESLNNIGKKRRYKKSLLASRARYKSVSMEDLDNHNFKAVLDKDHDQESLGSSNSELMNTLTPDNGSDDDDDCIIFGNSTVDLKSSGLSGTLRQASVPSDNDSTNKTQGTSRQISGPSKITSDLVSDVTSEKVKWSIDESMTAEMSDDCVQRVSYSLSEDDVPSYVRERAEDYENKLNDTDSVWIALSTEGDPHVLSMLLWDWLDQLKEPILRMQDLHELLQVIDNPLVGLQKLEKGARFTIEYLVKVISKLKPISNQTYHNIYEKLISHLTHSWVSAEVLEDSTKKSWAMSTRESVRDEDDKDHWGEMNGQLAFQLFSFFINLQQKLESKK